MQEYAKSLTQRTNVLVSRVIDIRKTETSILGENRGQHLRDFITFWCVSEEVLLVDMGSQDITTFSRFSDIFLR